MSIDRERAPRYIVSKKGGKASCMVVSYHLCLDNTYTCMYTDCCWKDIQKLGTVVGAS